MALSKMVFVHIDQVGSRIGNGGFVMLTQLAQELSGLGFDVGVFDHANRLKPYAFRWLSLGEAKFRIVSSETVLMNDGPVISAWLLPLLNSGFIDKINFDRIRYWCHGEILRDERKKSWLFVVKNLSDIAVNNSHIYSLYYDFGYRGNIHFLDNWVRNDLFVRGDVKTPNSVGYQSDNKIFSIADYLRERFNPVVICEGDQKQVAQAMQSCQFFVFWNRLADCFKEIGLHGETFGLSLFEAMACGCLCVARRHDGILFLKDIIPLADDLDQVEPTIGYLDGDVVAMKRQREFIEENYRWNDRRKNALLAFLE